MSNNKNVIVSEFDRKALKLIRENVRTFIKEASYKFDKSGLLLEIGPEYNEVANYFKKIKIETLDINLNARATYHGDITKKNEFLKKESYDVVVLTEVLEHTTDPFSAIKEIYRILKVNGILLITVPFNFRIHGPLPDCWRFTKYGLKELLKDFSKIEIDEIETENRSLMPIHYSVIAYK